MLHDTSQEHAIALCQVKRDTCYARQPGRVSWSSGHLIVTYKLQADALWERKPDIVSEVAAAGNSMFTDGSSRQSLAFIQQQASFTAYGDQD